MTKTEIKIQMSFNVIKTGTNQKLAYDFLLESLAHSNVCRITHRLQKIWRETV